MKIVEIKCKNCGKRVYVSDEFIRGEMFCTIGCMNVLDKRVKK